MELANRRGQWAKGRQKTTTKDDNDDNQSSISRRQASAGGAVVTVALVVHKLCPHLPDGCACRSACVLERHFLADSNRWTEKEKQLFNSEATSVTICAQCNLDEEEEEAEEEEKNATIQLHSLFLILV